MRGAPCGGGGSLSGGRPCPRRCTTVTSYWSGSARRCDPVTWCSSPGLRGPASCRSSARCGPTAGAGGSSGTTRSGRRTRGRSGRPTPRRWCGGGSGHGRDGYADQARVDATGPSGTPPGPGHRSRPRGVPLGGCTGVASAGRARGAARARATRRATPGWLLPGEMDAMGLTFALGPDVVHLVGWWNAKRASPAAPPAAHRATRRAPRHPPRTAPPAAPPGVAPARRDGRHGAHLRARA